MDGSIKSSTLFKRPVFEEPVVSGSKVSGVCDMFFVLNSHLM